MCLIWVELLKNFVMTDETKFLAHPSLIIHAYATLVILLQRPCDPVD